MSKILFESGDVGISTGTGFIPDGISFFTSFFGNPSDGTHAYAYIDADHVVEALRKVVINLASKYDGQVTKVYRLPLSAADRLSLAEGLKNAVGSGYGWFKIPLFAFDGIASKIASLFGRKDPVFFFTKYFGITSFKVCSQLIVWALHKFTSYRIRTRAGGVVNWKVVSPDYLHDLFQLPVNHARLIYENE
jgi:hypothetical protein